MKEWYWQRPSKYHTAPEISEVQKASDPWWMLRSSSQTYHKWEIADGTLCPCGATRVKIYPASHKVNA